MVWLTESPPDDGGDAWCKRGIGNDDDAERASKEENMHGHGYTSSSVHVGARQTSLLVTPEETQKKWRKHREEEKREER